LVVVATCAIICGERENDFATLVWCIGADQLMMGNNEPTWLGLTGSSHNNGNYPTRSLLSNVAQLYYFFDDPCWSCCKKLCYTKTLPPHRILFFPTAKHELPRF
jgi:hypothetical protein